MKLNNSQKTAIILLVVLFFVDLWAQNFRDFYINRQIDKIFHFWGGFFVGLFFLNYLKKIIAPKNGLLKNILILVGISLLVGVAWEFGEYMLSKIAGGEQNIDDTLSDLSFDMLGVMAMFFIHSLGPRHSHKNWGLF